MKLRLKFTLGLDHKQAFEHFPQQVNIRPCVRSDSVLRDAYASQRTPPSRDISVRSPSIALMRAHTHTQNYGSYKQVCLLAYISSLFYYYLFRISHSLLNILVQIANEMRLQKDYLEPKMGFYPVVVTLQ
jgi:hypothetical protein